jgi:two-component system, NarL family, nitrate/nitrite response regulator NarL
MRWGGVQAHKIAIMERVTWILIADDHALLRDTLAAALRHAFPGAQVDTAPDLPKALALIEAGGIARRPDIVLLDLRMPGMHGLEGLARFRGAYPGVRVGLLTGLAEAVHIEQAFSLGAVGYFPKTLGSQAFVEGVRTVLSGKTFVPTAPGGNGPLPAYRHNGDGPWRAPGAPSFTPRERTVIGCLARGLSNKVIAAELEVQEVTIKMHLRHICAKLGVTNRTQAALKLRDLGLLPVEGT